MKVKRGRVFAKNRKAELGAQLYPYIAGKVRLRKVLTSVDFIMREAWPQVPIARQKDWLADFLRSDPMRPRARYSAHQSTRFANFFCDAPEAQRVFLVGDFNGWNKTANPMERMPDGRWLLELALHHGHHQYYFLIDDEPRLDPKALGTTRNDRGEPVSLIAIS